MGAGLLAPICFRGSTAPSRRRRQADRHGHHSGAWPDLVRRRCPRARRPRGRQSGGGSQRHRRRVGDRNPLKLGRQPGGGSVNVAAILGGSVIDRLTPEALADAGVESALQTSLTNSVPDRALVRGEVRGYSVQEIEATIKRSPRRSARVRRPWRDHDWIRDRERMVPPFPHAESSRARGLVQAAAAQLDGLPSSSKSARPPSRPTTWPRSPMSSPWPAGAATRTRSRSRSPFRARAPGGAAGSDPHRGAKRPSRRRAPARSGGRPA